AVDDADVGSGLGVEPTEAHRGDRFGGRGDRARPGLGPDPGVGRAAAKVGQDSVVRGRGHDDLADRRGMVEYISERTAQLRDVELARAAQRDLLTDSEQQLEADRGRLGSSGETAGGL